MVGDSLSLRRALGVTRVARVTDLDRTGVEVACAVRPEGHVLQVTNGKGETFAEAARGALSEAAELWASERVEPSELRGGPDGLAYLPARDLFSGREVLVPAAAVRCPPAGAPLLGDAGVPWTTNGIGAAPRLEAAALHALLEAVERDQLARALPEAFTERAVRARLLDRGSLPREVAALAARVEARGFEVAFLDATGAIALPCAAALLLDLRRGPVPLAAGYACRLDPAAALRAALLEAAQSRLTDVHGAREDVAPMDPAGADALRRMIRGARPRRRAAAMPRAPARTPAAGLRAALSRLRRAGFRRAAALDLAPRGFPLRVAKVLVPGLRLSELL